jgi:hypothetical protein
VAFTDLHEIGEMFAALSGVPELKALRARVASPEAQRAREKEYRQQRLVKVQRAKVQAAYRERHLEDVRARDREYNQRPEVREKRKAYMKEWKKARKAQA